MKTVSKFFISLLALITLFGCEFITTDDPKEINSSQAIVIGTTGNLRASLMAIEEMNRLGIAKEIFNKEMILINGTQDALLQREAAVIIGPGSSGATINFVPTLINPTLNPRKVACISPSATNPALGQLADSGLVWRTILSDAFQGAALASEASKNRNLKTAAVLYANTPYGLGFANSFKASFEENGGVIKASIPFDETNVDFDFQTVLQQLYADKPEVVFFVITSSALAIRFSEQSVGGGYINNQYKPLIVSGDASFSQAFIQGANRTFLNGMVISTPDADRTTEVYKNFEKRYQEKYFVGGSSITGYEIAAYDAVIIATLAMIAANSDNPSVFVPFFRTVSDGSGFPVTRDNLAEGIAKLRAGEKINYQGVSGPCDFDSNGDVTNGSYALYTVQNGVPTLSGFVRIQ